MSMTTGTTDVATLEQLTESVKVADAIDTILAELSRAQSTITGVRPPVPELRESYEEHLARQAQAKGREALLPYLGSGLGRGALVQLADGSVKWDMINGIGVNMFGHGDAQLVATALRAALSDTVLQGNLQFNAEAIDLAQLLVSEASRQSRLRHCFLINSGALANESALKVCFQKNAPADRVLAFAGGFAGRTTTMVQIGDSAAGRQGLPVTHQVDYVPFYDAERGDDSTRETLDRLQTHLDRFPGGHACFVMELVQGEGGFNRAPREFFTALMGRCRDQGIAVWVDEIQTFGRTNELFHFQQLDLGEWIDVVTIGKLSQVCGCLYTADYNPKPGLLSATFVGSTVALAVGRAMITRLRDGDYYGPSGRIERLQKAFRTHAGRLVDRHPEWFPPIALGNGRTSTGYFDGVGGMMRLTPFGGAKPHIMAAVRHLFDEGVIALYCGRDPYHLRFLVPVGIMEPPEFEDVFTIVETAFARTAADD